LKLETSNLKRSTIHALRVSGHHKSRSINQERCNIIVLIVLHLK
jgi:hypothetical protein